MNLLERAQWLLWERVPAVVSRRFPGFAAALADGSYLTAWPPVAVLGLLLSFVLGLAIGGFRPSLEQTFVTSIAWPLLLVAPAAFGAGLGFAALVGFALGDFLVFPHLFLFGNDIASHLVKERLPLLITYEVLAGLLVLLPIAAPALADGVLRPLRRLVGQPARLVVRVPVTAAVVALLAGTWAASAQILIRPIWTFNGAFPSTTLVQPLRTQGIYLMALAAILTGVRVLVEAWLRQRGRLASTPVQREPARPTRRASLPRELVNVLASSALLTLLFSGLLDAPWQAGLLFGSLLLSQLLRAFVLPRAPSYARALGRLPVLLRMLALGAIGYAVGTVVFAMTAINPPFLDVSWTPMVIAACVMIVVAALVMPPEPRVANTEPAPG